TRFSRDWSSDVCSSDLGQVTQRVEGHQKNEQLPPEQLRTENGQNGCADYYAQRIGGDKVAYLWLRNAEILGDIGHQPHDGEFTGTDTKAAHRQRKDDQPGRKAGLGIVVGGAQSDLLDSIREEKARHCQGWVL